MIDLGNRYLIAKTDPITFVTEDIGIYTISINANDIATMGGDPLWFLVTILLPEGSTTFELVEGIFSQLSMACRDMGIAFCGGHTEITSGIDRPIVIGVMLGMVEKGRSITTSGARIGDDILITKTIAIEGTSIIAREKGTELEGIFGREFVNRCKELIHKPGISIVRDAQIVRDTADIHSMHDPTEGGLATGLLELAKAADVGLIVEGDDIPILPECKRLSQHYGIDPLGLIASGTLLITVNPATTDSLIKSLNKESIPCTRIGMVVEKEKGIKIRRGDNLSELPSFERDEITKLFEQDNGS